MHVKKKRRVKKKVLVYVIMLIILYLIILFFKYKTALNNKNYQSKILNFVNNNLSIEREKSYNECIAKEYTKSDMTDEIKNKIEEIDKYIKKNYEASVYYEDINTGFKYTYNENTVYYGASLIKLVEAMYIFDEAEKGNIDINDTLTYKSKYIEAYSDGMEKHKIGDDVSIKELISYAIMYSDNSAHFMLSDYIGTDNLKAYGKKLGAKYTLYGTDTFGSQTAYDTNIYLKHANEIIENSKEYGPLLKQYMMNTYYNSLYLTDKDSNNVAHKYGWYSYYYHDIGIVYETRPYYISILTLHGNDDYEKVVRNIHKKVNELHHLYYKNRQQVCKDKIYGN